jgi:polysaccharide biosynthesis protein PslH
VTIATLRNSDVTPVDIAALKEFATEVVVFDRPAAPNLNLISKLQRSVDFLISGTPPGVRSSYSPDFQNWLDRAVKDEKFDVIACEHSVNESVNENYLNSTWKHSLRMVVNVHSSVYATCKNQLETKTAEKPFRDRFLN